MGKTITIVTVIDVVGALATESLSENVYLLDTNKMGGSENIGTDYLKTAVQKGDRIVWTIQALECEAFASIEDIIIDHEYCEPKQETYKGTDVTYWVGTVKKNVKLVPYNIKYKVGSRPEGMTTTSNPALIGKATA